MFKRLFTLALILGTAALAPPVQAQGVAPCFDRDKLVENLANGYKESQTGIGLRGPQQLLELWSSAETGTFTILITRADGLSCVLASGKNWHMMPILTQDAENAS